MNTLYQNFLNKIAWPFSISLTISEVSNMAKKAFSLGCLPLIIVNKFESKTYPPFFTFGKYNSISYKDPTSE